MFASNLFSENARSDWYIIDFGYWNAVIKMLKLYVELCYVFIWYTEYN